MKLNFPQIKLGKYSILEDINLDISRSDFNHIIGPNGCGKSTLFKAILGYIKVDGEFSIKNDQVAIVSDYSSLPEDIKVKDIIKLLKINKKENDHDELLKLCDIKKLEGKRISKLSTGEKKKVEIFVALHKKKKLLILDELTNGLDSNSSRKLLNFLKEVQIKSDCIILITTHNLNEVYYLKGKYFFFDPIKKNFKEKKIATYEDLSSEYMKYIL